MARITPAVVVSARTLAREVRSGARSARVLVVDALARIDAGDRHTHAIVTHTADHALAGAEAIDLAVARGEDPGPLAGVPITIKDMHDTQGTRTSYGLPWYARHVPLRDSVPVARLRAAGAIVLGKTALPFAGYDWQTRHTFHQRTNHPLDASRTCGGSSGGAAVALACGYAALELGADLAGSIRVPSHFCGTYGLKTTEGLVADEGHGPPITARMPLHMVVIGPMGRCLDDLALELDVITATDVSPELQPRTPHRIAWTDTLCGVSCDAATRRALERLVAALEAAGVTTEQVTPPDCSDSAPLHLWGAVNGHEFARCWPWPLRTWPMRQAFRLGPAALAVGRSAFSRALAVGMASTRAAHARAIEARAAFAVTLDAWLAGYDALLAPIAATAAFTHRRRPRPIDVDGRPVPYSMAQSAFCCPFNLGGGPAVAMPIGATETGLPIGVQACGPRGSDRELLALARGMETALAARPPAA